MLQQPYRNPYTSSMPLYHSNGYPMQPMNHYNQPIMPQYGMNIPNPSYAMNTHGPDMYDPYHYPYQYASQDAFPSLQQNQSMKLFQNPLEPDDDYQFSQYGKQQAYLNMYPRPPQIPKPSSTILQSFKSQDGSLDLNKMVNTAGSLINAINQVSGMAKSLTGIFKI